MNKIHIVEETNRLDKFISLKENETRNQIEQLIKKGFVSVNGKVVTRPGVKLKLEAKVEINFDEIEKSKIKEEESLYKVDFDVEVIYEDDEILVINKPYSLIVHGAASVKEATLVDWLKLRNISLSTISGEERHGIVHRLDRGTSGVMVIAKTNAAHVSLSKQLEEKTMGRYYLAAIDLALKEDVTIENLIGRSSSNRLKMGTVDNGRFARSSFAKVQLSKNEKYELIACKLYTGRTHQIRVHLSTIHRHILGDNLYGFKGELNKIRRFYLHAYNLYLIHPKTNEQMNFTANLANDMTEFLNKEFNMEILHEKLNKDNISNLFNSSSEFLSE
ncbi:MAG: RluA family pseudouridine synthase [Campylobacterales bacterium]|nr:RluA family pseudouridine synthase [Campylobacterales bacterium]